ncbi:hypothetical protein SHI21_09525 [Bacteriovorax sp. PP10]|uniref:Lipoprotein n=1 Tax=Bacteriovorax antarcticus TaxID=3088717 RepID=A0ABU5VTR0_9BACT|nr:hypothetical protein [Bacteriovorax sp. PP10]MEA9356443.1 hypothetical protein [Bacteriovorax sp. PP10]
MKKNTLVLMTVSLTVLASCSSPESYQTKMSRYTPKQYGVNQVPEITTSGFQFTTQKGSRLPASADKGVSVESVQSDEATLSNKKLYFLTLFGQYESMNKYASEFDAPKVSICPHFHNSLIEHNDRRPAGFSSRVSAKSTKKFVYDSTKLNDAEYVSNHPELSLPLAKNEVTPKVIDIFRSEGSKLNDSKMNELVHTALDIHLSKTYAEIRELCEYGVSDNYYIYENMITHIKNSNFPPAEKNMNTLLKTTVFSNIALVTAVEKIQPQITRSIASVEKKKDVSAPYSNELMTRLNVEWAREYFDHLRSAK